MIGKVIQEKRKEAGLTQAQLADRLGVTAPAVNRWEKDLSYPDASLLAPLARVLRIDMNQLFSFYQYLSEKERKLITFKVNEMLMGKDDENAFAYIGDILRQYPTDGLLYKDLADTLLGLRALFKSTNPTIYLGKIVEFYEKAAELCPEEEEAISNILVSLYSEIGDTEKAEAAWSRLKELEYDKTICHAEMQFALKNYGAAASEMKAAILKRAVDLSAEIDFLRDALALNGDAEESADAKQLGADLRKLFGLWEGLNSISSVTEAVSTCDPAAEVEHLETLLRLVPESSALSQLPLFSDVSLGRKPGEKKTAADLLADIMKLLQPKSNN